MNYDISVVIPMFNASRTIVRALSSIENQVDARFREVIVIDDGSTDNSFNIVGEYKKKSMLNIIVLRQLNKGVSSARNLGINYSNGKYIAFLDSDDEWKPEKTKEQMELFMIHDVVMVGGNHFERPRFEMGAFAFISYKMQLFKNYFQTSTVIVDGRILKLFDGFYSKQRYAEEGRFYFEVLKHGRAVLLNKHVVVYDGGNKRGFGYSGLSKKIFKMQLGEIRNIFFAYRNLNVSVLLFISSILFSCAKFIRRLFVVLLKAH
jgi:glycosyltransferase involved in cell wall biosynthesis